MATKDSYRANRRILRLENELRSVREMNSKILQKMEDLVNVNQRFEDRGADQRDEESFKADNFVKKHVSFHNFSRCFMFFGKL